jgi:hypothetical protein
MRTIQERNAIKESKGKKSKVNKVKEIKKIDKKITVCAESKIEDKIKYLDFVYLEKTEYDKLEKEY